MVCDAGASLLTLYAHLTRFYAQLTSLYKAHLKVTACLGMNVESLTGSAVCSGRVVTEPAAAATGSYTQSAINNSFWATKPVVDS